MNYCFPFDKVPKGSRVVLYGWGYVGRQYFAQLKKTGYATVLWCVDARCNDPVIRNREVEICIPFSFCEFFSVYDGTSDETF